MLTGKRIILAVVLTLMALVVLSPIRAGVPPGLLLNYLIPIPYVPMFHVGLPQARVDGHVWNGTEAAPNVHVYLDSSIQIGEHGETLQYDVVSDSSGLYSALVEPSTYRIYVQTSPGKQSVEEGEVKVGRFDHVRYDLRL